MHFLIDADSLIYKAGCANEVRSWLTLNEEGLVLWEHQYKKDAVAAMGDREGLTLQKSKYAKPLKGAISNMKTLLEKIVSHRRCTSYEVFISGAGNFRYEIAEDYKGTRNPDDRPIQEEQIREYMVRRWNAMVIDGMEVDDWVSIRVLDDLKENVIVTIDKDLNNTPGWHYNYDTDTAYYVEEHEASLNFYRQLIMGDRTDNIAGLKGFGKKRAEEILPEPLPDEELCAIVWELYQENGKDADYFIQQARLLWMLREEGIMWTPPIKL